MTRDETEKTALETAREALIGLRTRWIGESRKSEFASIWLQVADELRVAVHSKLDPALSADREARVRLLGEAIRAVEDAGGDNAQFHAEAIRALLAPQPEEEPGREPTLMAAYAQGVEDAAGQVEYHCDCEHADVPGLVRLLVTDQTLRTTEEDLLRKLAEAKRGSGDAK